MDLRNLPLKERLKILVESLDGAEETVAACRAYGVDSFSVKGDVSKDEDCRSMVKAAIERWK